MSDHRNDLIRGVGSRLAQGGSRQCLMISEMLRAITDHADQYYLLGTRWPVCDRFAKYLFRKERSHHNHCSQIVHNLLKVFATFRHGRKKALVCIKKFLHTFALFILNVTLRQEGRVSIGRLLRDLKKEQ